MTDINAAPSPVEGGQAILTASALDFVADLHRKFATTAAGAADGPVGPAPRKIATVGPRLSRPRPLASAPASGRSPPHRPTSGPPGGDHRTDRSQDDDQRAELGCRCLAGRSRGREHAAWANVVGGQVNLFEAVRRTISHRTDDRDDVLREDGALPTTVMRPRGWHLPERHVTCDGDPVWRVPWSTSASTSSTTPRSSSPAGVGPTSTCRSWRATWRRGSGTTSSCSPRNGPPCPRPSSGP